VWYTGDKQVEKWGKGQGENENLFENSAGDRVPGGAILSGGADYRLAVNGGSGMKKKIELVIAFLLVAALSFGGGWAFCLYEQTRNAEATGDQNPGLTLPGEVEKRIVTKSEIEEKLVEIDQLATYSGEYTVSKAVDYKRYFLDDIPVPGTTNKINIECTGIVKVGYRVSEITPTVDNDSQKIYIALPEPDVLDNYIIWDSVKVSESNNILNPIDFEQYQKLIGEIEAEGLAKAEEDGIYTAAEEHIKVVIRNFLSGFQEYEIVFL